MSARVSSAASAVAAVASLTWRRTRRSRTLWISLALTALPIAAGLAMRLGSGSLDDAWSTILSSQQVLLAVLCPLYAAASLGEEIESGTMTYLWSRPVPRWSVAAGKLVALTPIVALMITASAAATMVVAHGAPPAASSLAALALGAGVLSVASTGVATLVPRHSMVVPMVYLLFVDLPVGELPMALYRVSMTRHLRVLADGASGGAVEAALWLAGLTAVWAAIGLWRLRDLE
ncbi:MAG: ABC transporter permease [Kofleriaceae bacterium]